MYVYVFSIFHYHDPSQESELNKYREKYIYLRQKEGNVKNRTHMQPNDNKWIVMFLPQRTNKPPFVNKNNFSYAFVIGFGIVLLTSKVVLVGGYFLVHSQYEYLTKFDD